MCSRFGASGVCNSAQAVRNKRKICCNREVAASKQSECQSLCCLRRIADSAQTAGHKVGTCASNNARLEEHTRSTTSTIDFDGRCLSLDSVR